MRPGGTRAGAEGGGEGAQVGRGEGAGGGVAGGEGEGAGHSGTGLICEMVLVKKLKLEASGHECRKQYSLSTSPCLSCKS